MTAQKTLKQEIDNITDQLNSGALFETETEELCDELEHLEVRVHHTGEHSLELGKIHFTLGMIKAAHAYHHEEAIQRLQNALEINQQHNFLDDSQVVTAHTNIIASCIVAGATDTAKQYINILCAYFETHAIEEELHLGALSLIGFFYHELGMYTDALRIKQSTLARGTQLYGSDSHILLPVMRNISENFYCLKDINKSEYYQHQALALARKNADTATEVEILFKLGVLYYEQGSNKRARHYFSLGLSTAQASNDEQLIEFAQSNFDEFKQRTKKWWQWW